MAIQRRRASGELSPSELEYLCRGYTISGRYFDEPEPFESVRHARDAWQRDSKAVWNEFQNPSSGNLYLGDRPWAAMPDVPIIGPDTATRYAQAVTSGRILAGEPVRRACERHLRDLEEGHKRGLCWDWAAAERTIHYFRDVLRLNGGEHEGKPFILEPSQVFIVGSLFGWKGEDGYRRFRMAFIEIGKGNGKSPLAAGIGLYMLTADGEPRAEIYSVAVDKDQAGILFRDAVAMVDQSPALSQRITQNGGAGNVWRLNHPDSGSIFKPLSSENSGRGKSGFRVHCGLVDEVHEHPTNAMVEFVRANTKGRRQALIPMITNSGFNRQSVCYHYHEYGIRVVEDLVQDESFFSYICALDDGDDWRDSSVWIKANPLLGVSITEKYVSEQIHMAEGMPSKQGIVRRLNCCEWTDKEEVWIEAELWRANAGEIDLDSLVGRRCWGGLDLSAKNDLSALVLVFEPDENGKKAVLSFFWTPADTLAEREEKDRAPYTYWVEQGLIEAVPGKIIDNAAIAQKVGEVISLYQLVVLACDPWEFERFEQALDDLGIVVKLKKHGQGFNKEMNEAIRILEEDLIQERLMHGNNPVLSMCAANAKPDTSRLSEMRKFSKALATGRIDGVVALAMGDRMSEKRDEEESGWGPASGPADPSKPKPQTPSETDNFIPIGGFY